MEVNLTTEAGNRVEEIVVDMEGNASDRSNRSSTINYDLTKCQNGRFSLLERQQILDILKEELKSQLDALGLSNTMNQSTFCKLFSNESVLNLVFHLFDVQSDGKISPSHIIELFKDALGTSGREFVDLLDTLIYVVANESNLDFELFKRIFTLNAVQYKFYALIDTKHTDSVTVDAIIALWADVTMSRKIKQNEEQLRNADKIFESYKKEGTEELTLEDFKKLIPCKNPFFAERAFRLFDRDRSNSISIKEYRETLQQFSNQSVDDKVRFLFQIYDQNGDGVIKLEELKSVLTACSEENGMKFSDEQMDQLTLALYEDAKQREDGEPDNGIGFEELKAQMAKQPGLLENLSTSLERFLVPVIPSKNKKDQRSSSSVFSKKYLRNNIPIVLFVTGYMAINLILFLSRMVDYMATNNVLYMFARASGQALNFNCAFVVVLMLRHSITWLRMRGFASILPLDHHVYLHKVCGIMIVFFSFLHTVMHLINFPLKVADHVVSNATNQTHTAIEWLFTADPGKYGLVPGWACLTGWVLVVLLGIMAAFSLPIVRKSGCFEIFYWSHLLFVPFWINLILHGPNFWYWFIGPGFLFIFVEKLAQFINRWFRQGRSFISSAVLLPSRVTHLVIKKPPNFHYHPGDYVYIQIPSLTRYEWHPFTISSAPELPDYLWLHVRCAGGWTNKLYEFFELKMAESCCYHQGSTVVCQPSCKSCYNKLLQNKHPSTFVMNIKRSQNKSSDICTLTHGGSSTCQSVKKIGSFKKQQSCVADSVNPRCLDSQVSVCSIRRNSNIYRNPLLPSRIISMPTPVIEDPEPIIPENPLKIRKRNISTPRATYAPETLATSNTMSTNNNEILSASGLLDSSSTTSISRRNSHPRTENLLLEQAVEVRIDGPYGAPSSHIFRAQHAVLIAAGIGVTPFASILQSIMNRYHAVRQSCPSCKHNWVAQMPDSIMNLKKVDFFWINRDQQSFEWFVSLLSQLEMEQAEMGGALERFLDLHMYMTSALNKNDMKAVGLQMALDLLHAKEKRDLVTGLKTRSNAGRPNWDKVFQKILDEKKGKVTVFYCGPPQLARELKGKCDTFGFNFRKEIF